MTAGIDRALRLVEEDFGRDLALAPETQIIKDLRFVDNGKIITSAGVTAGIDRCLYMVARLFGEDTANTLNTIMSLLK